MIFVAGFALVAASCSQGSTTGGEPGGSISGGNTTSSGGKTSASSTVNSGGSSQPGDTGGASTADTGGSGDTGGSAGGETSAGSTTAAGGTTSSTTSAGGSTKTGGTTGAAGTTAVGGSTKTGGTTGAAGTTAAGGSTKTGGTTAAGGSTSAGGSSSAGGTPSSGGAGGGASLPPETIVPTLDGYMWIGTCSDGPQTGLDCPLLPLTGGACPNATSTDFNTQGVFRSVPHTVGGTSGTQYTINFEVRGILGTKCYTGGKARTPGLSASPEVSNDGWYEGGSPVPSKWNTYEIHVKPAVGTTNLNPRDQTENIYYLNAFPYPPITIGKDTWCEMHETFPMKYTASFPVMGGGTITLTLHDSNCLGQMNCGGPDLQTSCANPRTMDLTGMSPQPASFTQPYKQSNGFYPQWVLFDVKTVTSP